MATYRRGRVRWHTTGRPTPTPTSSWSARSAVRAHGPRRGAHPADARWRSDRVRGQPGRGPGDVEHVERLIGEPVVASVPVDPDVLDAERLGLAPIDHAPGSPAIVGLVRCLTQAGPPAAAWIFRAPKCLSRRSSVVPCTPTSGGMPESGESTAGWSRSRPTGAPPRGLASLTYRPAGPARCLGRGGRDDRCPRTFSHVRRGDAGGGRGRGLRRCAGAGHSREALSLAETAAGASRSARPASAAGDPAVAQRVPDRTGQSCWGGEGDYCAIQVLLVRCPRA